MLHGADLRAREPLDPVGLQNLMLSGAPTYLELFPDASGLVHATMIMPARSTTATTHVARDFRFVLRESQYASQLEISRDDAASRFFGIIPVGRIRRSALERILFFGEAGQANPAASATGLTRLLLTYRQFASQIGSSLDTDRLDAASLRSIRPRYFSSLNRLFQEELFESLLDFTSEDFRDLVVELGAQRPELVFDLVFADLDSSPRELTRLVRDLATRGASRILRRHLARGLLRIMGLR